MFRTGFTDRFVYAKGRLTADAVVSDIKSVRFDCGAETIVVPFTEPVTRARAIQEAENWLSRPITDEWWDSYVAEYDPDREMTYYDNATHQRVLVGARPPGKCRGWLNTGYDYLEGWHVDETGCMELRVVTN
jgi:hypothetical protein